MRDHQYVTTAIIQAALRITSCVAWAVIVGCLTAATTQAQTRTPKFRIESQVYVDGDQTPVSQNVTLFDDGVVYDLQMETSANRLPSEIVIFDERRRELILLDVGRKLAWTIADLRLMKMLDQLRRETLNNDKTSFLVNDSFTETHDWSSDIVTLESQSIHYRVKGKRPADDTLLPRYYDFLDQFTRLSASDPKRVPPFPRLTLNKSIKAMGWIPSEVKVKIDPNSLFKEPFSAISKHVLVMSLSEADQDRIKFARKCWLEFESCTLSEYRQIPAASKRLARKSKKDKSRNDTTSDNLRR